MFEFLFKRPDEQPGTAAVPAAPAAPAAQALRALQADQLRALNGDEAGAVEFILRAEFSELRLAAAEFVRTPAQLERVHAAMRNTDRRVAKLMQARLDAIRHHAAELERGHACLAQARRLAVEDPLTPNHVADLDRRWAVIGAPELVAEFDTVRAALARRLEAQVRLQRGVLDSVAALRQLGAGGLPAAALGQRLEQMAQAHGAALAAPEHTSLPRHLIEEFATEHAQLVAGLGALEHEQAALAARASALAGWLAAPAGLRAESVRKTWQQLAPVSDAGAAAELEQRFEQLLASLAPTRAESLSKAVAAAPDAGFLDTLEAMEAALQQGALGIAAEHDKTLKEARGAHLAAPQAERLVQARAELKRLSDWARWGGNVSREELIKAVEHLATQTSAMSELAKKVGSMRERWKSLDALSGHAPKSLWERFDRACSAAYAPAAAHFRQLSDERHANAAKAQALIEEAGAEAVRLGAAQELDWKHMANALQRLRQAWTHLGTIDRKEKKRLDQRFADALKSLQAPLDERRKGEVAVRHELIGSVAGLNPQDRHALDALRAIQERWQEQARALPLERKVEQALWQRFRAQCDAVFAKRKESAHAADAERRTHESAKEAICARLEAAAPDADAAGAGQLLRAAASEWQAIGAVPRSHEAQIEKRYQSAVAALSQQVDNARRRAAQAQASALHDKLGLCLALEAELAQCGQGDGAAPDWDARWSALPSLGADYERCLRARFTAARAAFGAGRAAYVALLEQNRAALLQELLRLEIGAGIDSGNEFARERLKLQVEVLQSSLKSGQKPASQASRFLQLCATPALVDGPTAGRILQLFGRAAKAAT
jgi:hypothetical protein